MAEHPIDDALEALGGTEVAPPRSEFANALEDRLRAAHGAGVVAPAQVRAAATAGPPRLRLVAAAAAVVAILAAAVVTSGGDDMPETQLTAATDTSVVLPDGSIVAATPGLRLPDGSLVITGPAGSAEVDGVSIPADSQAVVEDGVARVLPRDAVPPPAPARPAPKTTTTTAGGSGGGVIVPPTAPATTVVTQPPSTTSTTSAAREEPERLELTAQRVPKSFVDLRWSRFEGPDFSQYVVVRTVRSGDGSGEESTVVFATPDRERLTHRDRLPDGVDHAAYRVIALDRSGRVVGASPVVRA